MVVNVQSSLSDTADSMDALVRVGLAWGLERNAACRLAEKALSATPNRADLPTLDDTFVVMLASLTCPTGDLVKIAGKVVERWRHVSAGTLPWAAVVHDYPVDLTAADGSESEQTASFQCLMDARCIVFGTCLSDGAPIGDEFTILRTGILSGSRDDEPDPYPIADRRWDALLTEAALAAIAQGRRPILLLRDVAEECDIAEPELS